ncbi:alpha-L-glutamate ligase-like protein [Nitrosomonas sp.]|uniref:alpha-L-glutamate ligase-like protein n=1 Tax=Nitrosomonas sp. TaxID=42353 RepID=UPI0025D8AA01|nr:alpha-L-glutamate ligase-like protein [Nitrosomonas sp.]
MFGFFEKLKKSGVMGMNQRNADFILRYNKRSLYPLVDDKLRTKYLALASGIAVPELYGVIEIQHDVANFPEIVKDHEDFVIKPAHGSGGSGICVITGRLNNRYRQSNGDLLTEEDIEYHLSNILSGLYSLGGQPDQALIEYRVKFDPLFEAVSYRGVPDIRTIVFRGIPVACMVRLPTRMSDGKANLHQGAVGAGIDLVTGRTTHAIWQNFPIEQHPDTGATISGLEIPHWHKLLTLAAQCHDLVGLGYLGVDVVLDRELGPLVLELNARPGLSIQIANRRGMSRLLEKIAKLENIPASAAERATLGQELFLANQI